jgi:hypothetical protein
VQPTDSTVQHIVDKDSMHRCIDDMKEGDAAVLVMKMEDHVEWWVHGFPMFTETLGMLEAAKVFVINQYNARCAEDDERAP